MITVARFLYDGLRGAQMETHTFDDPKDILELQFVIDYKEDIGRYVFKQFSVRPINGVGNEDKWHLLAEYKTADDWLHDTINVATLTTKDSVELLKVIPEFISE